MQLVILAAGKGTRMGDLTSVTPKPMLTLNGKPILAYKIEHCPSSIDEVILVVGYNRDIVHTYFGETYAGKKIRYVVQEKLNGTGAALHAAKPLLADRFMIIMGDDLYLKSDLEKLAAHERALLAFPLPQDMIFGIVKVDASGNLSEVIEKSHAYKGDLANTGAYVLTKEFFEYPLVSVGNGEYGLPQTMATMAKDMPIKVVSADRWMPVTSPADRDEAERSVQDFYPA